MEEERLVVVVGGGGKENKDMETNAGRRKSKGGEKREKREMEV